MVTLIGRRELLKDDIDPRAVACLSADVIPCNLAILVHDEHRRTRDTLGWMKDAVLTNEVLVDIRKNGVRQIQFRRHFLTVGGTVRTDGDHLGAEALNLGVIFLQLTELRAAKPSSLSPVKDD
jgi:hypothetical protein